MMEVRESAWMRQYYRKAIALSAAFGAIIVVVPALGMVLRGDGGTTAELPWLAAIALFSLALVPVIALVRRRMLGEGAGLHAVVDQAMVPQDRYRRMLAAVGVSMAMCTLPVLFGLARVLAGAGSGELYSSVAGSVLLFVLYAPRYGQWQAWFAQRSRFR